MSASRRATGWTAFFVVLFIWMVPLLQVLLTLGLSIVMAGQSHASTPNQFYVGVKSVLIAVEVTNDQAVEVNLTRDDAQSIVQSILQRGLEKVPNLQISAISRQDGRILNPGVLTLMVHITVRPVSNTDRNVNSIVAVSLNLARADLPGIAAPLFAVPPEPILGSLDQSEMRSRFLAIAERQLKRAVIDPLANLSAGSVR